MNRILRHWVWILPVMVGLTIGFSFNHSKSTVASATTRVGPSSFTKYALNNGNNPVYESPATQNWQQNWTYTATEPLQQISVANGVVYASGDGGNLASRKNDRIYAVDAQTGHALWTKHLNNMSMTTPVVADGQVFVGSGTQQFQGNNLAKENNLNSTGLIRGTGPNAIYALDATNGHVVWKHSTPGENMPTFVYHGGILYVANGNGKVYAFNAKTGHEMWSLSIGSYVSMSSPVLTRGVLYVSGAHPYKLYAINVKTHRLLWSSPVPNVFGGSDDSSLAAKNGLIYVMGTTGTWKQPNSYVYAFTHQGQVRWQTNLGTGPLPTDIEVSAPTVVGHTVYVGSPITNSEYALNSLTGHIQWKFHAAGPVSESAAVANGVLYVGDGNGYLYALNPKTGQEIATRFLSGSLAADFPVVVGKTIYQPDENGQLFAIPTSDLTSQAVHQPPNLPLPSGTLGKEIKKGEALFMGHSLSPKGMSCDTCHTGGGTLANYHKGLVIPSLLGAAAGFPQVINGKIRTLDGQINHCIKGMGGKPLSVNDPRMLELNLYLHWLSSGFIDHLAATTKTGSSPGGGCK